MKKSCAALIGALCVVLSTLSIAPAVEALDAPTVGQSAGREPESVLVIGEQPGPGLWKVSKGEHVMWVLGVYAPLPRRMTWNPKHVESAIAESQEVLLPGQVDVGADVGFFRGITLLPALIRATRNPNDALLQDVLPPATYARWLPFKEKYIGDDGGVERLRPTLAAGKLSSAAMRSRGLSYEDSIEDTVRKIAKKNKVRVHRLPDITRKAAIEDPRGMLQSARATEFADAACFAESLDHLEPDIELLQMRANAWARGDLQALRNNGEAGRGDAGQGNYCMAAFIDALRAGTFGEKGVEMKAMLDALDAQSELAFAELERTGSTSRR